MLKVIKKFFNTIGQRGSILLREDGRFFVMLTILNLPIFIQEFFYGGRIIPFNESFSNAMPNFWQGTFFILLFCVAINLLLKNHLRIKFFLQTTLIILFAIFFVTDIFLLHKFNLVLHVNMIQIVMGTNPSETKDFLSNYVLTFPVIFGVIFFIAAIVALSKGLNKFFLNRSEERLKRFSIDLRIIFLPIILFWCGTIVWAVASILFKQTEIIFQKTTFGRNISRCVEAFDSIGNESKILAELDSQTEAEKILSDNSSVPYVILILGEATTRNHMSLYGYKLPTTPLLDLRNEHGEIFKLTDTISCANYTMAAMEKIFTFAEKDDDVEWYRHANIFDILRRANYHTVWLSNQSPVGFWGNLDRIYGNRCDEEFFVEPKEKFSFERKLDATLLPMLDEFISRSHEKNFLAIHLYGTHSIYNERYPDEFAKFTPDDEDKPTLEGRTFTAEYDNAVLYNDFIVNEIIRRFEDKNAMIIYISDHGEEVFENDREFAGHSMEESGNRSMIEIPAIIWASKKFREHYPEKISALNSALDRPYRTDYLIHALLDLLDIRTTSFEPEKSIFNARFDSSLPRIYNQQPYIKDE